MYCSGLVSIDAAGERVCDIEAAQEGGAGVFRSWYKYRLVGAKYFMSGLASCAFGAFF